MSIERRNRSSVVPSLGEETIVSLTALKAATETAAASLWAIFAWFSDAYGYNAAVNFLVVQTRNCCLCLSVIFHLYKAEALRATRVAVHDNLCARYSTECFECSAECFVSGVKR